MMYNCRVFVLSACPLAHVLAVRIQRCQVQALQRPITRVQKHLRSCCERTACESVQFHVLQHQVLESKRPNAYLYVV